MAAQVDPAVGEKPHPFGFQQGPLQVATGAGQGDATPGIDHPMPRQIVPVGAGMQQPGDLAGRPGVPRQAGYQSVGNDPACRDGAKDRDDRPGQRVQPMTRPCATGWFLCVHQDGSVSCGA